MKVSDYMMAATIVAMVVFAAVTKYKDHESTAFHGVVVQVENDFYNKAK